MDKNSKTLENIKTVMAVEGYHLNNSDISMLDQYLNNKVSEKQVVDSIKSQYG